MREAGKRRWRIAGLTVSVSAVFVTGIVLAGVVSAAPLSASANGRAMAQLAPTKLVLPDLSTRGAVMKYVRSLGVDPTGLVIQRGARNYAGPNCPGPNWNCTRASKVVQIAAPLARARTIAGAQALATAFKKGTENVYECRAATCNAPAQIGADRNVVICDQDTTQAQTIDGNVVQVQTCTATQTGARNEFRVKQTIKQREGAVQLAKQVATAAQTATEENRAHVKQYVDQNSNVHATGATVQRQAAEQYVDLNQTGTGDADNWGRTDQTVKENAHATATGAAAILQEQQAEDIDPDTPPPPAEPAQTSSIVDQDSDTGTNTSHRSLAHDLKAHANAQSGAVTQRQGVFNGGLNASSEDFVHQFSAGVSRSDNNLDEKQDAHAQTEGVAVIEQTAPQYCCSAQDFNPKNQFNAHESSTQIAKGADSPVQFTSLFVDMQSSGEARFTQSAKQNDEHETFRDEGEVCFSNLTLGDVGDDDGPGPLQAVGSCVDDDDSTVPD